MTTAGPGDTMDVPRTDDRRIVVPTGPYPLRGRLTVPPDAIGIVLLARAVDGAIEPDRGILRALGDAGLATLRLGLLSATEAEDSALRGHPEALARRLAAATDWVRTVPGCTGLPVGYLGIGTGSATALWASALAGAGIGAVVAVAGRPDLAIPRLAAVKAPTLLVVGGEDRGLVELDRHLQSLLSGDCRVAVVPTTVHSFEDAAALEPVADLSAYWFARHLGPPDGDAPCPAWLGSIPRHRHVIGGAPRL